MNIAFEQLTVALPAWRVNEVTVALRAYLAARRDNITAATVRGRLTAPPAQIADNLSRIAAFDEIIESIETGVFITTNQPNT